MRPWTPDEHHTASVMWGMGVSAEIIGANLKRTALSIVGRMHRARLVKGFALKPHHIAEQRRRRGRAVLAGACKLHGIST